VWCGIVDYGVIVELDTLASRQVEWSAEVVAVGIGDGDIGEVAVTSVGDHYPPVTGVTGSTGILIQEDAVIVAVDGLLDVDIRVDDIVGASSSSVQAPPVTS